MQSLDECPRKSTRTNENRLCRFATVMNLPSTTLLFLLQSLAKPHTARTGKQEATSRRQRDSARSQHLHTVHPSARSPTSAVSFRYSKSLGRACSATSEASSDASRNFASPWKCRNRQEKKGTQIPEGARSRSLFGQAPSLLSMRVCSARIS